MNPGIIMFTYRVNDACISEREFHSTFFKSVGKDNFISVIWIFCKSTTSCHCSCCPVVISHDTFIHANHLKRRRKTCLDIFLEFLTMLSALQVVVSLSASGEHDRPSSPRVQQVGHSQTCSSAESLQLWEHQPLFT